MSATSGSPFSIRYTTQPAEVSRLVITLGSQARLRLQKLGHHRPNETPGSVLVFFHTDDSGIGKFHRTAIRTTGQQERSQTLEVWKMAHYENVIRIDLQEVCHDGGIIRWIQSRSVTGAGSPPNRGCKEMCCLLSSFLAAVLNQRNSDSQARQEIRNLLDFGITLAGQTATGIFFRRFCLSMLNEVDTHSTSQYPIYNSGRIWCARTSIACIIEPSVSSSSTLVL